MKHAKVSGREIKKKVRELLKSDMIGNWIEELNEFPDMIVVNSLISLLSTMDLSIKWRAILAIGTLINVIAEKNMEYARTLIRRLMWSLSEESGSIGWGVPEAIGEVLARNDDLAEEYTEIFISYIRKDGNFLANEVLQEGTLWGIGRIAEVRPDILKRCNTGSHIMEFLNSKNPVSRALSARALGLLHEEEASSLLERLLSDYTTVKLFIMEKMYILQVKDLAMEALFLIRPEKSYKRPL